MPYIVQEKRDVLDPTIEELHRLLVDLETDDENNNMEGNLNYVVSRLLMMVYGDRESTRYAQINDAMGMIFCAALEYYRKVAAPYEDQKEFENGAVETFRSDPEVVGTVDIEITPQGMEKLNDEKLTQEQFLDSVYD